MQLSPFLLNHVYVHLFTYSFFPVFSLICLFSNLLFNTFQNTYCIFEVLFQCGLQCEFTVDKYIRYIQSNLFSSQNLNFWINVSWGKYYTEIGSAKSSKQQYFIFILVTGIMDKVSLYQNLQRSKTESSLESNNKLGNLDLKCNKSAKSLRYHLFFWNRITQNSHIGITK